MSGFDLMVSLVRTCIECVHWGKPWELWVGVGEPQNPVALLCNPASSAQFSLPQYSAPLHPTPISLPGRVSFEGPRGTLTSPSLRTPKGSFVTLQLLARSWYPEKKNVPFVALIEVGIPVT